VEGQDGPELEAEPAGPDPGLGADRQRAVLDERARVGAGRDAGPVEGLRGRAAGIAARSAIEELTRGRQQLALKRRRGWRLGSRDPRRRATGKQEREHEQDAREACGLHASPFDRRSLTEITSVIDQAHRAAKIPARGRNYVEELKRSGGADLARRVAEQRAG